MPIVTSPEEIKKAVTDQLYWDGRVDPADIRVDIEDGVVRLTGTVRTLEERALAGGDAAVIAGIKNVDNRLTVRPSRRAAFPDDREIRSSIRDSLLWNSTIDASRIVVSVKEGTVILEGDVDSFWQKMKAQEITEKVKGVRAVENEITVVPERAFEDNVIKEDVVAALERDLGSDAGTIEVEVYNGVVTLIGTVPSLSTYRGAEEIANYIHGVIGVKNDLIIENVEGSIPR